MEKYKDGDPDNDQETRIESKLAKKTSHTDYRVTNRGGKGIIGIVNSPRNGNVTSSFPVFEGDEILISTNKGRVRNIFAKIVLLNIAKNA